MMLQYSEPSNLVGDIVGMYVDIMPGDKEFQGRRADLRNNKQTLPGIIRGILQDDVSITINSSWSPVNMVDKSAQNVSGLANAISKTLSSSKGGKGQAAGKVINFLDALSGKISTNEFANISGLGRGKMGPGSMKIYEKSSISGFNISLKWYMPGAEIDVIKNLILLLYCVYPISTSAYDNILGSNNYSWSDGVLGTFGNIFTSISEVNDAVAKVLSSYASTYYTPPFLKLRISDWLTVSPMIMTNLNVKLGRVAYDYNDGGTIRQLPVFVTATMSFDYAQDQVLQGDYLNDVEGAESLSILGVQLAGSNPFRYSDIRGST